MLETVCGPEAGGWMHARGSASDELQWSAAGAPVQAHLRCDGRYQTSAAAAAVAPCPGTFAAVAAAAAAAAAWPPDVGGARERG
eukprot:483193-Pelagomonas_calceolata.AAC.4